MFVRTTGVMLLLTLFVSEASQAQQAPRPATRRPAQAAPGTPAATAPAKTSTTQKGVVISEEAAVFNQADFDSQIIATLKPGEVYEMTRGKRGPFYKVRVKPGMTGWVSEADIRPASADALQEIKEAKAANKKAATKTADTSKKSKRRKSIENTRYRGLGLESMQFKEDTMGAVRTANVMLYGFRMSGPNTMMDGDINTDAEFLFTSSAPSYYADATRNSAGGFFFLGNFLFINEMPQSRTMMAYYGFGPVVRLTHFEVSLTDPGTSKSKSYTLDDLAVGAVFNGGVAFAFDRYALRLDLRYYWEAQRYTSFAFALQQDF